jgi:hypothetical protein
MGEEVNFAKLWAAFSQVVEKTYLYRSINLQDLHSQVDLLVSEGLMQYGPGTANGYKRTIQVKVTRKQVLETCQSDVFFAPMLSTMDGVPAAI